MNNQIYNYILSHYDFDEPILSDELKEKFDNISSGTIRQMFKRLCDKGVLKRVSPGIYYRPNPNSYFDIPFIDISNVIRDKYLFRDGNRIGYESGINFANKLGLTSQTASIETIVSNEVSEKKRLVKINKNRIIVSAPRVFINNSNYRLLQILDLLNDFKQNSEFELFEAEKNIKQYLDKLDLELKEIEVCVSKYPLKVQVKFYKMGVYHEFTRKYRGF